MPQLPPIAPPSIFKPRPLRVWLVIGLFVVYLIVSYLIFFEAIAPVADFSIQPAIAADSAAYWDASGVRTINVADQQYAGADAGSNLFGPCSRPSYSAQISMLLSPIPFCSFFA